jgi:MFS family permease
MLDLSAGMFIGLGLSGCSFPVVMAAFSKILPESWRSVAFGACTAAGSFGQFVFSPVAVVLMDAYGWQNALTIFAVTMMVVVPLSFILMTRGTQTRRSELAAPQQSLKQALTEALSHRSYVLLVLGYFTCGFQLQFVTIHMPPFLVDRGLSAEVGGWTIAVIGLFNVIGSLASGWLGGFLSKRLLLSFIYFARAAAILGFIMVPLSPLSCMVFGAVMGLLWLSTVPATTGLIVLMFGTRWLATLTGFAFFSHQVGGFLGVYLGGIAFEHTGSYDLMWWLAILFGVLSGLINLPIVEKPVARAAAPASA